MKRITGTHVYGLLQCPRKVALDLHEPRERRRPPREEEEFTLQRGRDHEARVVAALGWPAPEYPDHDHEAGARATLAMLADGVVGVSQGVLLDDRRLGIPDLLRREAGESRFGDWHYVVGDVKSSGDARSDQVMQVVFYSALLADLQQRAPDYAYIVLKDGREERFQVADYAPVLAEVEARIGSLLADASLARPFRSRSCDGCHWSELCGPELERADDLSLLGGMTRGVRAVLESVGLGTCASLRDASIERTARQTHLEPALLRRFERAARAREAQAPLPERRSRQHPIDPAAFVHLLTDPFLDRVLSIGVLWPGARGEEFRFACPRDRGAEWRVFMDLIGGLPAELRLLHYGSALPRWYEEHSHGRNASIAVESRFVDLAPRLRGAAMYPAPVFGLAEHVRHGLGLDPHRFGRAHGAALHALDAAGVEWLRAKCRGDLDDLAALKEAWLGDGQVRV